MLLPIFLTLFLPVTAYLFAGLFFRRKLFRHTDRYNAVANMLFSSTFACSCCFFILYISEYTAALSLTSRFVFWRIALVFMCTLLVFVIPGYIVALATRSLSSAAYVRAIVGACSLAVFWLGVNRLGHVLPEVRSQSWLAIEALVGRIGIIGVALMALLSGFGAVMGPVTMLAFFRTIPSPEEAAALVSSLKRSTERIFYLRKRQRLLARMPNSIMRKTPKRNRTPVESGVQMDVEIENLRHAQQQMFLALHEKRLTQKQYDQSLTLWGRCINAVSYFYAIFCAYKLFSCSVNIVWDRTPSGEDPVSKMVRIALTWGGPDLVGFFDLATISQYVSFALVGVMSLVSFRSFLRWFLGVFSVVSHTNSSRRDVVVLVGTWLMGAYFLSSTVLFRVNLPSRYSAVITEVLSEMKFDFYHRWFDVIFLPSALITASAIALKRLVKRDNRAVKKKT